MEFLIADTFTDSLGRLTGDEQKAVKTTAFDLQLDASSPGLSFHRLDRAKDKNFWSVRVSSDVRLIVHKTEASFLLCYVDHHDKAYAWAEKRKLETHPRTGAAQFVEIRETVKEVVRVTTIEAPKAALLKKVTDDELLQYGVPGEWLTEVRAATEDTLLSVVDHLPAEAAEAVLELATGGRPRVHAASAMVVRNDSITAPTIAAASPFAHPDAQRRFRLVSGQDELAQALDYPWDKWTVFLHPEQRQWVEKDFNGPARVAGSAGTGKTIVALHRAVHLAKKNPDARVLVTTFSDTLANALHGKLKRLVSNAPRLAERIDVYSLPTLGLRLYKSHVGKGQVVTNDVLRGLLRDAASAAGPHSFSPRFLRSEWDEIVDAWQLTDWESYREVPRLGRKTRLPEAQRKVLWSIFDRVRTQLAAQGLVTEAALWKAVASAITNGAKVGWDHAVVDEAQDLAIGHLRFLAALGGERPNALFFAGDLGQRIFQPPFSWKTLGVDIRGRSRTLRVNYRTSHQIRTQADRLLAPVVTDIDGNREERGDTVSVFNGPAPTVVSYANEGEEIAGVGGWLAQRVKEGVLAHELGVFVRSDAQVERAKTAVAAGGLSFKVLDERVETTSGHVSIATMHNAKGLEFRVVAVMACDDEVIPLQARIEAVGDDADLKEIYDTERQLLYVACTRARDQLMVSSVRPASEFIDDFGASDGVLGA